MDPNHHRVWLNYNLNTSVQVQQMMLYQKQFVRDKLKINKKTFLIKAIKASFM